MKKYYIPSKNGTLEQVTEKEYLSLMGDAQHRPYVNSLYCGDITLAEVPTELQKAVQETVKNRISKYGTYDAQPATIGDIQRLVKSLINGNLTKYQVRHLLNEITLIRDNATDSVASRAIDLYPVLSHDGSLIKAGTRINWAGVIKRAAVDLWDNVENNPDDAPQLWEDINYTKGYRVIPEVITVGTAFAKDECGWWENKLYKSLLDANVYTPAQYPAGWEEVVLEAK